MSMIDVPLWWDRESDRSGRALRPDVRAAASQLWNRAHRRAEFVMSDSAQAADTMESAVAQVSRYLDRGEVAVFSRDVHGLLMIAFQRSLRRRASRMRRLETLGGSEELAAWAVDRKWANRVNARIELEEIVARLGRRSQNILALRYVGHTWNETAQVLATPVAAVRSAFWRDMARVRRELKTNPLGSKEKSRIG